MSPLWSTTLIGLIAFASNLVADADSASASMQRDPSDWVYLDNGNVRLGVMRSSGAAIGFLAESGSSRNLLNHFDRGRFVQQSYYGDSDGSLWDKRTWCYNPVQGGDWHGKTPSLLQLKSDSKTLYSRSIPVHWATGELLRECVMEQWIELQGKLVHARFQMTYNGTNTHAPRHQEIPAIFVDPALNTLVTYSGTAPWTGGPLMRRVPGTNNEYLKIPEHWVAWVDTNNFGIGAYVPAAEEVTCYKFHGGSGSDCSYVAPIKTLSLQPGLKFTYDAWFTIGVVDQIRKQFTGLSRKTP